MPDSKQKIGPENVMIKIYAIILLLNEKKTIRVGETIFFSNTLIIAGTLYDSILHILIENL